MINGLDISTYQEQSQYGKLIDWPALKADPRNFRYIWVKIAEGSDIRNYPVADTARQISGAMLVAFDAINTYHFHWYREFVNGKWAIVPAQAQAQTYYDACALANFIPRHPMTDCEDPLVGQFLDFHDTESANKALAFARGLNNHLKAYHQAITEIFGVRPDIYTGAWWWDRFGKLILAYYPKEAAWWADYKFVLADYDGALNLPAGITKDQVLAWQFTSTPNPPVSAIPTGHRVPGDALDCEVWMQSDDDFVKWCGKPVAPPITTLTDHDRIDKLETWAITQGYKVA